jgi:hypothetical protein
LRIENDGLADNVEKRDPEKRDSKWTEGLFCIINVIVGCMIGGLGALVLWPLSTTKALLRDKIQSQVKLARGRQGRKVES